MTAAAPAARAEPRGLLMRTEPRVVLHVMAWITLLMLAGLLLLGALVTSFNVGMAVPDGTHTFGQQLWEYRWWDKAFGIQLEHSHRLAGASVGFAILVLFLATLLTSPRSSLCLTATAALGAVIVQGLFGAFRVDFNARFGTAFAAVHGAWAQIVAMLVVTLVAMTSKWWMTCQSDWTSAAPNVRKLTIALVALSYVQIVVGALFRHRSVGFYEHATIGYSLLACVMALGAYILIDETVRRRLAKPLAFVAVMVFVQIVLGNASALATGLIPRDLRPEITLVQAFVTAAHLLAGSLYFAATYMLAVVAHRTLRPAEGGA